MNSRALLENNQLMPPSDYLEQDAALRTAIIKWNVAGIEAIGKALAIGDPMTSELFGISDAELVEIANQGKSRLMRLANSGVPLFIFRLERPGGIESVHSKTLESLKQSLLATFNTALPIRASSQTLDRSDRLTAAIESWNIAGIDAMRLAVDHQNPMTQNLFGLSREMINEFALLNRTIIRALARTAIPMFSFRLGRGRPGHPAAVQNEDLLLTLVLSSFSDCKPVGA